MLDMKLFRWAHAQMSATLFQRMADAISPINGGKPQEFEDLINDCRRVSRKIRDELISNPDLYQDQFEAFIQIANDFTRLGCKAQAAQKEGGCHD